MAALHDVRAWLGRPPRGLVVALVLLSAAAVAVSVLSLEHVHPALSWNRDEPVYLWHIDVLASGRLTAPLGDPVAAFRPWLGGISDGGYFSQYTLGWPLVLLAADLLVGTPGGAVVAATVLAVASAVLLTREVTGREDVAVVVGVLFLASPVVVIQAGVHLGYLFTVGLGNLVLVLGWSGLRRASPWRLAWAGALLGWILLTRPFDAVVWGLVLLVGGAAAHRADVVRRGWPVAAVAAPFVIVTLAYNVRVTGEALTFPIVAADPLDTFGLGTRRLMPTFEPVDYHVGRALHSTAKNSAFAALFVAGNVVTIALAAAGAWWGRRRPETWRLVLLGVAFPVGYFFFWGTYISSLTARLVGSIYYVPSMVPLLVLAALGGLELRRRYRRTFVLACLAAVVVTAPVLVNRLDVNRRNSLAQGPWTASVAGLEDGEEDVLVIVAESGHYLLFKNPMSSNAPELDDQILYAVDRGVGNFETLAAHPDRTPYLQVADAGAEELGPKEDPITPVVTLEPVELVTGATLRVDASFMPLDGAPVVLPFVEIDGAARWGSLAEVTGAADGSSGASFHLGTGGHEVPAGASIVRLGFGAGADVESARQSPRVRWELTVRTDGDELTALVPMQQYVRFPVGDTFEWYPRPGYGPGTGASVSAGPRDAVRPGADGKVSAGLHSRVVVLRQRDVTCRE